MECPKCERALELPPALVLAQMQKVISRKCKGCKCIVHYNQETKATTIHYDPSEGE